MPKVKRQKFLYEGYMGESTRNELRHSLSLGKPVRRAERSGGPKDQDGSHESGFVGSPANRKETSHRYTETHHARGATIVRLEKKKRSWYVEPKVTPVAKTDSAMGLFFHWFHERLISYAILVRPPHIFDWSWELIAIASPISGYTFRDGRFFDLSEWGVVSVLIERKPRLEHHVVCPPWIIPFQNFQNWRSHEGSNKSHRVERKRSHRPEESRNAERQPSSYRFHSVVPRISKQTITV